MALPDMRQDNDEQRARRERPSRRHARRSGDALLRIDPVDGALVFEVVGELTESTAPEIVDRLRKACDGDATCVIVDLSAASAVDRTGAAALLGEYRRLAGQGRRLALVCRDPAIRHELQCGAGARLAVYRSRARALASCVSRPDRAAPRRSFAPPRLHSRDDQALLRRYAKYREAATRDVLVRRYMPLARHLARRYASDESLEDVFQVACLALVNAVDRYDPNRGTAFTSFAVPTIVGEIKRHFRDKTWSLRVPRELQELAMRIDRISPQLAASLGRQPSVAEIAEATGSTVEHVLEAFEVAQGHYATSLEAGADDDGEPSEGSPCLGDLIGTTESGYARVDERLALDPLLMCLTPRERAILVLRFRHDMTQREIGARVGLSQMHVSRILRQAIARLHALAEGRPWPASV